MTVHCGICVHCGVCICLVELVSQNCSCTGTIRQEKDGRLTIKNRLPCCTSITKQVWLATFVPLTLIFKVSDAD